MFDRESIHICHVSAKCQAIYQSQGGLRATEDGQALWGAAMLVQSGTICVERLWAILQTMLPTASRSITLKWCKILSDLTFIKYKLQHLQVQLHGLTVTNELTSSSMQGIKGLVRSGLYSPEAWDLSTPALP